MILVLHTILQELRQQKELLSRSLALLEQVGRSGGSEHPTIRADVHLRLASAHMVSPDEVTQSSSTTPPAAVPKRGQSRSSPSQRRQRTRARPGSRPGSRTAAQIIRATTEDGVGGALNTAQDSSNDRGPRLTRGGLRGNRRAGGGRGGGPTTEDSMSTDEPHRDQRQAPSTPAGGPGHTRSSTAVAVANLLRGIEILRGVVYTDAGWFGTDTDDSSEGTCETSEGTCETSESSEVAEAEMPHFLDEEVRFSLARLMDCTIALAAEVAQAPARELQPRTDDALRFIDMAIYECLWAPARPPPMAGATLHQHAADDTHSTGGAEAKEASRADYERSADEARRSAVVWLRQSAAARHRVPNGSYSIDGIRSDETFHGVSRLPRPASVLEVVGDLLQAAVQGSREESGQADSPNVKGRMFWPPLNERSPGTPITSTLSWGQLPNICRVLGELEANREREDDRNDGSDQVCGCQLNSRCQ